MKNLCLAPLPAILLAALCTGQAQAGDELDRSFGTQGFVSLGFVANGANNADHAVVGCAAPDGTLLVSGSASSGQRIVTLRLDDAGGLDPAFSTDGKESFDIDGGIAAEIVGLCLPDGKVVLAYELYDGTAQGDGNVRVVRVLPSTGKPDPSFGSGGQVTVNLDDYAAGMGPWESPLGLNVTPGGDLLVSGIYTPGAETSAAALGGFVIRIDAATHAAQVALSHTFDDTIREFSGALPGPDGQLWATATRQLAVGDAQALVVALDSATLAYRGTPHPSVGDRIASGRVVASGAGLVMTGRQIDRQSFLARFTGTTQQQILLPPVGGAFVRGAPQPGMATPATILLATRVAPDATTRAAAFARVRLTSRGGLLLDSVYGTRGVELVSNPGGCPSPPQQVFHRYTFWRGRPTAVGAIDRNCGVGAPDFDYHVFRLHAPSFGHGFE